MPAFLIADVKLTDDAWVPDYAAKVHDIAAKHGGRYLSRSANIRTIEGEPTDTTVIALVQFPSTEALQAFVDDPEYRPFAEARQAGSRSHLRAIDDSDATGGVPYLPKG